MRFRSKLMQWAALLAICTGSAKAVPQLSEAELKAVFLFHFTQFVEWPISVFPSADAPFVIGILGPDPFGGALDNIVRGEKVGQHPLIVRGVSGYQAERDCQILYVTKIAESLLDPAKLNKAPVLTVGESAAFYEAGGLIEFVTDHRHVRLRVNLTAARERSLVISAKLLRVAEVSDSEPMMMKYYEREEAARLIQPRASTHDGYPRLILRETPSQFFPRGRIPSANIEVSNAAGSSPRARAFDRSGVLDSSPVVP
jgi:hypothetical protein